jgi:5-formyltetrahydrofolate cyclo-ligase
LKHTIRKYLLWKRDAIDPDLKKEKESSIEKSLFELSEFKDAEKILFYASFRSEVNTINYIQDVIKLGKKVILPVVDAKQKRLDLYYVNDVSELIPGYKEIPEPGILKNREASLGDINLVVIPGTGFDTKGFRLGYGGGYYDRLLSYESKLLANIEHIPTVALAFEEQIGNSIPSEAHDITVDIIITDKRVISCNK